MLKKFIASKNLYADVLIAAFASNI